MADIPSGIGRNSDNICHKIKKRVYYLMYICSNYL